MGVERFDPEFPNQQPIGNPLVVPAGDHALTFHLAPEFDIATCDDEPLGPAARISVSAGDRFHVFPYRLLGARAARGCLLLRTAHDWAAFRWSVVPIPAEFAHGARLGRVWRPAAAPVSVCCHSPAQDATPAHLRAAHRGTSSQSCSARKAARRRADSSHVQHRQPSRLGVLPYARLGRIVCPAPPHVEVPDDSRQLYAPPGAGVTDSRPGARTKFRWLLAACFAALTVATLPVLALPRLHYVERSLTLDLALGAALTFAALSVAVLAWVRYREGEDPHVLYQAAAFFGLFVGDLIRLAIVIVGRDDALGMSLQRPGQTPIYLWTIQAMVAAVMLLVGGVATLRRWPRDTQPVALVIGAPVALIVLADAIVLSVAPNLPPIATPTSVTELDGVSQVLIPDGPSLALLALQLTIGSLFLGAAILKTAIYERTAGTPTALLAIGLIVAAFAEIHFADAPGGYTSLVTGWDILRALFYAVLLSGVAIGVRNDLRALRAANLELTRLRGLEGRRAALEERARLAREVHDGLVQDLWLARLLQARLGRLPRLNAEDRLLAGQVDAAIESALLEARRVLAIVRHSQSSGAALDDELRRLAIEFSERFGLAADVTVEGHLVPLPEAAQAELVSIVREAMTNARKHAAAERVRVNVSGEEGLVRVVVADDGRGFEPQQAEAGFGLQSMRERARAIGAELSLASRPGEGTVVMLLLRPTATNDQDADAYASPLDNGAVNR